jgi:hypothetical protein
MYRKASVYAGLGRLPTERLGCDALPWREGEFW